MTAAADLNGHVPSVSSTAAPATGLQESKALYTVASVELADSRGDAECNIKVTHIPTGLVWQVRRRLSEWQLFEENLKRDTGRVRSSLHAYSVPDVPGHPLAQQASTRRSGFGGFFRRFSAPSVDPSRLHVQVGHLQDHLREHLGNQKLCSNLALHRFIGLRPPDVPSIVRIARLEPVGRLVEAVLEVHTAQECFDEFLGPDFCALPTHAECTAVLVNVVDSGRRGLLDEKLEIVSRKVMPIAASAVMVFSDLSPGAFFEFQVVSSNVMGRSAEVKIRLAMPTVDEAPPPAQMEVKEPAQVDQSIPLVSEAGDEPVTVVAEEPEQDPAFVLEKPLEEAPPAQEVQTLLSDAVPAAVSDPNAPPEVASAEAQPELVVGESPSGPSGEDSAASSTASPPATEEKKLSEEKLNPSHVEASKAKEVPEEDYPPISPSVLAGAPSPTDLQEDFKAAPEILEESSQPAEAAQELQEEREVLEEVPSEPELVSSSSSSAAPQRREVPSEPDAVPSSSSSAAPQRREEASAPPPPQPTRKPPRPGCLFIKSFEVRLAQVPKAPGAAAPGPDLDALIEKVQSETGLTEQSAIRMLLGCDLDLSITLQRISQIKAWRQKWRADEVRSNFQVELEMPGQYGPSPPHHAEVMKFVTVNPCALTTKEGNPVSLWYVGTANSSAAGSIKDEHLQRWSMAVFEYVDLWITERSEKTGRLAGHIQVFDLTGMSLWQISSSGLVDKIKAAMSAGEFYVEAVSHIFVINSSSVFTMAWNLVKSFISPRTASKINVSNTVPQELLDMLGSESAAALPVLLQQRKAAAPVQRPPPLPTDW